MSTRALVLAGGGLTGIGWELGVMLGMRTAGIDVLGWDRIVGTSAGSVVGGSLGDPGDLTALGSNLRSIEPGALRAHEESLDTTILATINGLWFGPASIANGPDARTRAEIGRLARGVVAEREDEFIAIIERILPARTWPAALVVTAVDIADGSPRTFDADSGVPLVSAVAASCAVPGVFPAVTIDGRRYMDGGVRSASNADLAAGHDLVVVIAPHSSTDVTDDLFVRELNDLRAAGSRVVEVVLDEASAVVFSEDTMDASRAGPAATVGFALGTRAATLIEAA